MAGIITLSLLDLRFFAHHGWYEQESRQGQSFRVDLWVSYPEASSTIDALEQTIDYTVIYSILKEEMEHPRRLLEQLAQSILDRIKITFPQVKQIRIHVQKSAPPVPRLDGKLGVQLERHF
jgi:dihydroneopterin aldolase